MTIRSALLGATASFLLFGSAIAHDHAPQGWYVSLGAGVNWVHDDAYQTYELGVPFFPGEASYEAGYIIAGAIGRDLGTNWRVELEAAFRGNDIKRFCSIAAPCSATDADVSEFSQMINVFYDVPVNNLWEISVGAGLGGNLVTVGKYTSQDIDDYALAGQLMAQVSYGLNERTKLFADYRHMAMGDPMLELPAAPGEALELDKSNTSLMLGVRFNLQQDAAPKIEEPKPEKPVAEAPKEFIVFFGFNKSHLTSEAVHVVGDAAAAAKKHGSASISIVGHTDTSGSTDYNMALSMRRAQAVKDSLIAHGIEASMVSTAGRGETELLVNTGDGVKEPQNRRATIDLK
jgi:outer membrane protein OmpA-like peptidoglycan-associated protein